MKECTGAVGTLADKHTCVIRFKDGKIEEIKMPDA